MRLFHRRDRARRVRERAGGFLSHRASRELGVGRARDRRPGYSVGRHRAPARQPAPRCPAHSPAHVHGELRDRQARRGAGDAACPQERRRDRNPDRSTRAPAGRRHGPVLRPAGGDVVGAREAHYLIEKGSVAIDGISLTVFNIRRKKNAATFKVALIPHTLKVTTLGSKGPNDAVNIESDLLVKYVERVASPYLSNGKGKKGAAKSKSTRQMASGGL